jgi:Glycosyltransferase family 87
MLIPGDGLMSDSIEQYYVYYPLALIITVTVIAAILDVPWAKRISPYMIAAGWLVFAAKTVIYSSTGTDFNVFWEAGQATLQGNSPYSVAAAVNPPTAVPFYILLASIPQPLSLLGWTVVNAIAAALLVWVSYQMLRGQDYPYKVMLPNRVLNGLSVVVALSLPCHFSLRLGQFTFLITVCIILAISAYGRGRQIFAGIIYAIATIKVNTALPFLMLLVDRRSWRFWLTMSLSVLALCVMIPGPARLFPWVQQSLGNIVALAQPGKINDYSVLSSDFHNMIGFDSIFYHLGMGDRNQVRICQLVAMTTLGAWIGFKSIGQRDDGSRGATCAIVALYAMVFTYHRVQDGVILAIPLVYVMSQLQTQTGLSRRWLMGAMAAIIGALYWHPKLNVVIVAIVDRLQVSSLSRVASAIFLPFHTWLVLAAILFITLGGVSQVKSEFQPSVNRASVSRDSRRSLKM